YNLSGSATADVDYFRPGGVVTFAAGELSKQIVLQTKGDLLVEGDETIIVTLGSVTGSGHTADGATAVGTIIDKVVLEPPASGKAASYMYGTSGNDTLIGDKYNNSLNGGAGQDKAIGGAGDDTYSVESMGDVVVENPNEGIDTVESYGSYVLSANVENLKLLGTNLTGTGNELANRILGGKGNDVLNGKAGNDWLTGGAGSDTFVFEKGTGHDVVTDFVTNGTAHDVVQLTGFGYTSFSQIQSSMTQVGADTQLTLSDGGKVTFLNHALSDFVAENFGYKTLTMNPSYAFSGSPVAIEGNNLVFTLSRTVDAGAQTANFIWGGTATAGSDYGTPTGVVAFAPGELTKQVVLSTYMDNLTEVNESVIIKLTGITGPGSFDPSGQATGLIIEPDGQAVPSAPPASGKAASYMYGTSGNDTLIGDKYNNSLNGGAGQD
ncbi:MAG: hypothetical protein EOO38_21205, partial [Cytophagaceae bacterium]